MTKILKKNRCFVIGLGWSSSIVANKCAKAGIKVVALERGWTSKILLIFWVRMMSINM